MKLELNDEQIWTKADRDYDEMKEREIMLEEPIEEKHAKSTYAETLRENIELRRENATLMSLCATRFDMINNLELRIKELKEDNKKLRDYISKEKK